MSQIAGNYAISKVPPGVKEEMLLRSQPSPTKSKKKVVHWVGQRDSPRRYRCELLAYENKVLAGPLAPSRAQPAGVNSTKATPATQAYMEKRIKELELEKDLGGLQMESERAEFSKFKEEKEVERVKVALQVAHQRTELVKLEKTVADLTKSLHFEQAARAHHAASALQRLHKRVEVEAELAHTRAEWSYAKKAFEDAAKDSGAFVTDLI